MGPQESLLRGVPGVTNAGFVQPADLVAVYGEHGAFVLPSRYEAWGFVIMEAVAAGLPVVCTAECGAAVELVRSCFNGRICGASDVEGLAESLRWIHDHEAELPAMGSRGLPLVAAYDSAVWAHRVVDACERLTGSQRSRYMTYPPASPPHTHRPPL